VKYTQKPRYKKGDKVHYQINFGASPMLAKSKAEKGKPKTGYVSKVKKGFSGKPEYLINSIMIPHINVLGLVENKQGENTMKIKMSELKEMIAGVLKEEESGYQKFFKATLADFGAKSPADLDDAKKKEFFAYIEKNWKGKNETLEPVSPAAGNPLKRVKAKKRDQMLAAEAKTEAYVRKLVREELKFVMFQDVPGGLSLKRAKKRILQKGSADTNSTV